MPMDQRDIDDNVGDMGGQNDGIRSQFRQVFGEWIVRHETLIEDGHTFRSSMYKAHEFFVIFYFVFIHD